MENQTLRQLVEFMKLLSLNGYEVYISAKEGKTKLIIEKDLT